MAHPVLHYGRWRIRWLDEHGRRKSETFDERKEALFALRRHEHETEEIKRGLRVATPADKTFNELCDYWIEKRAARKRSKEDDESIIRKHLRPAFGTMRLCDIGVEDVDDFIADRDQLAEKTLANHITLLGSMLRLATTFKVPWLLNVPKFRKPKVTLFSRDFRWLRNEDEIKRFLTAARAEGDNVFVLYATAIYTGMREGELAALEWSDVSFERRIITVQRSFDGPTKSDRVRYVPILDPLLPVLREWKLKHPGQLVFTNRDGNMLRESGRIFQEVLHRVLTAGGFPRVIVRGKERSYMRFHDTRHTFASHWVMRGGDIFKLQRVLGHQSIQMTMRYAHLAPDAFAADYARLGTAMATVEGQIIELATRSA